MSTRLRWSGHRSEDVTEGKGFLALTRASLVLPVPNGVIRDLLPYGGPEAAVPTVS